MIPALLTRMSIAPNSSLMLFSVAAIESTSVTFRARPLPFSPRYSLIAAAPPSDVAVPITLAPRSTKSSAIARPIPRLAPVTSATLPSKFIITSLLSGYYLAASSDAVSLTAEAVIVFTIRFVRPVRTLPGPNSSSFSTPCSFIACTPSVQRTGL